MRNFENFLQVEDFFEDEKLYPAEHFFTVCDVIKKANSILAKEFNGGKRLFYTKLKNGHPVIDYNDNETKQCEYTGLLVCEEEITK